MIYSELYFGDHISIFYTVREMYFIALRNVSSTFKSSQICPTHSGNVMGIAIFLHSLQPTSVYIGGK